MPPQESFPRDFGPYRLLRKTAQGGMAEIFLAQDKKGEICAVKRILPHLAHQESFIRMFIDEARIVSHLDHPNIACVYDQGKHEGYYYIAMEFVQGHSLLAVSERAKSMKIPLPRGLLAYVVAELLAGLACAHSARDAKGRHLGIVHRDVTPQNVLISYDGEVKLIDFGVAKARARLTQTEAGFTKGKLSYMSPEQARGEDLDSRSDLFSVGIILYEITTNSRLFNKEGPGGILGAIVNDPIPPPSLKAKSFPRDLETVVLRGLEKSVNERWQSADEMRDALLRFARKEKPQPGKQRLKDLTHDLFGAPESQKIIDEAKAVQAPTPDKVETYDEMVRGASVRIAGERVPELSSAEEIPKSVLPKEVVGDDETRMMRPDYEVKPEPSAAVKLEVTSDGTPIVQIPIPQDSVSVPVPDLPFRVKLAQFLDALGADLRLSWRTHRKRYIKILACLLGLLLLAGLYFTGAFGSMVRIVGDVPEDVKKVKREMGLAKKQVIDAGFLPTILRLDSLPPGATISFKGVGMGTTPQNLSDLPQGEVELQLALDGYRTHTEKVVLRPNQGMREIVIPLQRQVGSIRIETDPIGANVSVDGKRRGKAPLTIEGLTAGREVVIRASMRGRQSRSKTVLPGDNDVRSVFLSLPIDQQQIPAGAVSVSTSPISGCPVYIDGSLAGRSPMRHSARPGMHGLRVACENYGEENRTVTVVSGQTKKVDLHLRPTVFGWLTIEVIPPKGSQVRVGSGRWRNAPVQYLKVQPGNHIVYIRNQGLRRKMTKSVDVPPKKRISRRYNLLH